MLVVIDRLDEFHGDDVGQRRRRLGEQPNFAVGVDLGLEQVEVGHAERIAVGVRVGEQRGVGLPAKRLALRREVVRIATGRGGGLPAVRGGPRGEQRAQYLRTMLTA